MVSEVWASENVIADYYASGTPSMFNFDAGTAKGALVNAVRKGDPVSLVNSMLKYQNDFSQKNPDYIDAPFLSNHDMARIANTLVNDPDKIKTAAGLLMTMNGSPFVYYGEEIGMNTQYVYRANSFFICYLYFWISGIALVYNFLSVYRKPFATVLACSYLLWTASFMNYYFRIYTLADQYPNSLYNVPIKDAVDYVESHANFSTLYMDCTGMSEFYFFYYPVNPSAAASEEHYQNGSHGYEFGIDYATPGRIVQCLYRSQGEFGIYQQIKRFRTFPDRHAGLNSFLI